MTEKSMVTVSGTPPLFRSTGLPTPLIKNSTRSNVAESPRSIAVGVWAWRMLIANTIGPMVGVGVGAAVGVGLAVGAGVGVGMGVGTAVGDWVGVGVGAEVGKGIGVGVGVGAETGMITNGPRCTVLVQLPALSTVLRWNHHDPGDKRGLVVRATWLSRSFVASGSVSGAMLHSMENPSTPLISWGRSAPAS